jgi:hypothetical protein
MLLSRIVAKRQENVGQQFIQKILDCDSPQQVLQILQNPHATSIAMISNSRQKCTGNTILQVILSTTSSETSKKMTSTATTTTVANSTSTAAAAAAAAAAALSSRIRKSRFLRRSGEDDHNPTPVDENNESVQVRPSAMDSMHSRTRMVALFQIVEFLIQCTDPELKEHDHGSQYHSLIQVKNEINGELPLHTACRYSFQHQWESSSLSLSSTQEMKSSKVTTEQAAAAQGGSSGGGGVQWLDIVQYLIQSYPVACQTPDTAGNLPIHHACGNVAQLEILLCLVQTFPEAVKIPNISEESLPVHLAAAASFVVLPNTTDSNNDTTSTTRVVTSNNNNNNNKVQPSDSGQKEGIKSWSSFEVHRSYSEEEFDTVDLAQQVQNDKSQPSPGDLAKMEAQNRQRRQLFQSQQLEIVQFLVDYWPESIYRTNKQGETPLQAARNSDTPNYPLIEFLRDFEENHAPATQELGAADQESLSSLHMQDHAISNLQDSSLALDDRNPLNEYSTVDIDDIQQKVHPQTLDGGVDRASNDADDEDTFVTAANVKIEPSLDFYTNDMTAEATKIDSQNPLQTASADAVTNDMDDTCNDNVAEQSFIDGDEGDKGQASYSPIIIKEENSESFITNASVPSDKVCSTDVEHETLNDNNNDANSKVEIKNGRPTLTGMKLRNLSLDTLDTELDDSIDSSSSKVDLFDAK